LVILARVVPVLLMGRDARKSALLTMRDLILRSGVFAASRRMSLHGRI
jgi:hypothetical protein